MNCAELQANIDKLKQAGNKFQESIAKASLSGIKESGDLLVDLENEVLERYLEDFAEKNPLVFDYKFGGVVEGVDVKIHDTLVPCSDGRIVTIGDSGEIIIYEKDDDGKYSIAEKRDTHEEYTMIVGLPCGDVLLWANGLKLPSILVKEKGSDLEGIHGFEGFDSSAIIEDVKTLPNGDILVCSYPDGKPSVLTVTRVKRMDDGGSSVRYEAVGRGDVCIGGNDDVALTSFLIMPNSDVFLRSSEKGMFAMRSSGDSDDFMFEETDLFKGFVGEPLKAFELSNGDFAVVSTNVEVGIFRKNSDGGYESVSPAKVKSGSVLRGEMFRVRDSYRLGDGNIAIVSSDYRVFVFDVETGEFSDEVKGAKGDNPFDDIMIHGTSDGGLLAVDYGGILAMEYSGTKISSITTGSDGGYRFDEIKGFDEPINNVIGLSDGSFWVRGSEHYGIFRKDISIDALKASLGKIARASTK